MLLSKDNKYLFVINNKTPNKIDILDISDLTEPKLLNSILVSDKKENFIAEYKLDKDKKYLYTATYVDEKILVFDISNIYDIKKINEIPFLNFSSF
jgi:6-phosphogluconolactonase (cycloisomerase 2 family)